jgi:hypothetical protein
MGMVKALCPIAISVEQKYLRQQGTALPAEPPWAGP